ncbi:MAG: hypothetical protein PVF17_10290 [Ignavibacteria bacterium]
MFNLTKLLSHTVIILFLVSFLTDTKKIIAQTDETTVQITGKFVNENTGLPVQLDVELWCKLGGLDLTEEEIKAFVKADNKSETTVSYDSTGSFIINITNAIERMCYLEDSEGKLSDFFKIIPGEIIDLGEIKVNR